MELRNGGSERLVGLCLAVVLALMGGSAAADTFTADLADGEATLRAAIEAANGRPGLDTVMLQGSGAAVALALTGPLPAIADDLILTGPGRDSLTLSGGEGFAALETEAGVYVELTGATLSGPGGGARNKGTLVIKSCALTDGVGAAAVVNEGDLVMEDCMIEGNAGGGLLNTGTATLAQCRIEGNSALSGDGGGLNNERGGTLTLTGCEIVNNQASRGGGFYNAGTLTLEDCVVANNRANAGGGGFNLGALTFGGVLTLSQTKIFGNEAVIGGGIWTVGTEVNIDFCSVFDNYASFMGGGFYNNNHLAITESAVHGNTADSNEEEVELEAAGAVAAASPVFVENTGMAKGVFEIKQSLEGFVFPEGSSLNGGGFVNFLDSGMFMQNCTVSGNSEGIQVLTEQDLPDERVVIINGTIAFNDRDGLEVINSAATLTSSMLTDNGNNDRGSPITFFFCFVDNAYAIEPGKVIPFIGSGSGLAPLADNGGPTLTHALLPGSPAIDRGDPNYAGPPFIDQRGFPRVYNGRIDIGALESQPIDPEPLPPVQDHRGVEFILPFMPNIGSSTVKPELRFVNPNAVPIEIEVVFPVNAPVFSETVTVEAFGEAVVTLPPEAAAQTPGVVADRCAGAFSADEFACFMANRALGSADSALALPAGVLGKSYVLMDYDPFEAAQFAVAAVFDNTEVTITPARALPGRPAGTPFTVTLNRGEIYFDRSAQTGPAGSLTGTRVESNRPVAVVNGNFCAFVPSDTDYCDTLFEMAVPVRCWGDTVLAANPARRPAGSVYRVLAAEDGTAVSRNGIPLGTLNAGEYFEAGPLTGNHVFESGGKPIWVARYMTGGTSFGANGGDPSMVNLHPVNQYPNRYEFTAFDDPQFPAHYATVIAEDADVASGQIRLDGAPIPAGSFSPIGSSGFSAAVAELTPGPHSTRSEGVHFVVVDGYGESVSHAYPAGLRCPIVNPMDDADPPRCECEFIEGSNPPRWECRAEDNRPSEDQNGNGILDPGEDRNGNGAIDEDTGVVSVVLEPGSENLTLTSIVIPSAGVPVIEYSVRVTDPSRPADGSVTATDAAGNLCQSELKWKPPVDLACRVDWLGPLFDSYFDAELSVNGEILQAPAWCADLEELIPLSVWFDGSGLSLPGPQLFPALGGGPLPGIVDNPSNLPAVQFLLNWWTHYRDSFLNAFPGAGRNEVQAAFWKLLFRGERNVSPPAGFISWDDGLAAAIAADAESLAPSGYRPGPGDTVGVIVFLGDAIQTTVIQLPYERYMELVELGAIEDAGAEAAGTGAAGMPSMEGLAYPNGLARP